MDIYDQMIMMDAQHGGLCESKMGEGVILAAVGSLCLEATTSYIIGCAITILSETHGHLI